MAESEPIRVMTVDDHEILRGGLKFLLLAFEDIELVGEARSGLEALHLCGQVQPDVVLMDMMMPGMDGVATTRAIKEQHPEIQILVLSNDHASAHLLVDGFRLHGILVHRGRLARIRCPDVHLGDIRPCRGAQESQAQHNCVSH